MSQPNSSVQPSNLFLDCFIRGHQNNVKNWKEWRDSRDDRTLPIIVCGIDTSTITSNSKFEISNANFSNVLFKHCNFDSVSFKYCKFEN